MQTTNTFCICANIFTYLGDSKLSHSPPRAIPHQGEYIYGGNSVSGRKLGIGLDPLSDN